MKRKAITTIMLTTMFAMFLGPVMLVRGAEPPSVIDLVLLNIGYIVEPDGDEEWSQRIALHVTDPDGLDNLFIDGEISIEILAPDGNTYPMPSDRLEVEAVPEEGHVAIAWISWRPYPPVLGSYEITITDRDGLSTTYVTQPTVRVSDRVPTITYPPNFGVILETNPTFTWEAFSPETTWYVLSIWWPLKKVSVWRSPYISPDQLSYTYDGPELIRGETYHLAVVALEEEVVDVNEIHTVSSRREISFTALRAAVTTTIQPSSKDSYLVDANPDVNYGSHMDVIVYSGTPYPIRRALVQFDLSSIPSGSTISSATLKLYYFHFPPAGDPAGRTYWAYRVTHWWTEGGVTWNEYHYFDGLTTPANDWATPGGDYIETGGASATVPSIIQYVGVWMSWTVTDIVKAWVEDSEPNYGFLIKDSSEVKTWPPLGAQFFSRENLYEPELRPILEVTYLPDSDGDGLADTEELAGWDIPIYDCAGNHIDSYHVTSDPLKADTDEDGLNDFEERQGWFVVKIRYLERPWGWPIPIPPWEWVIYYVRSDPRNPDADADGVSDFVERAEGTDPNKADTDCDTAWNTDDKFEIDYGLNPLHPDTDSDGIKDGLEIDLWIKDAGYDPAKPELVPSEVLLGAVLKTNDPAIPAFIDMDPDTLSLKSQGEFITCYIELPEGYNVEDINIETVLLQYTIPAESKPTEIGDYDEDGIPDLMVKFDRQALIEYLGETVGEVELTISGEVAGVPFEGSDTIRVII